MSLTPSPQIGDGALQKCREGGRIVRTENVKTKAKRILDQLSEDKAKAAVSFLEFLEAKECWEATKEILRDNELMASIRRGKADIAAGRVKPWREIKKNV